MKQGQYSNCRRIEKPLQGLLRMLGALPGVRSRCSRPQATMSYAFGENKFLLFKQTTSSSNITASSHESFRKRGVNRPTAGGGEKQQDQPQQTSR